MAMRFERRQTIVIVTNTTSDWAPMGYRNIATNARSTNRVWTRQFETADEAKAELENVRNVRDLRGRG